MTGADQRVKAETRVLNDSVQVWILSQPPWIGEVVGVVAANSADGQWESFHKPSQKIAIRSTGVKLRTPTEMPGPNVIKLFTAVIYHHSMVISSFCVIKQDYLGIYGKMVLNYHRNICNIEFTLE